MEEDVRWKQRFVNYEKSYLQLKKFIDKPKLNELEEQGLIKCFEYTYELAWNLMKDYLVYQGITNITGSRDAIRQAFNKSLINNGQDWMKMIEDRILTVHTYNEPTALQVGKRIVSVYFNLFTDFYHQMQTIL